MHNSAQGDTPKLTYAQHLRRKLVDLCRDIGEGKYGHEHVSLHVFEREIDLALTMRPMDFKTFGDWHDFMEASELRDLVRRLVDVSSSAYLLLGALETPTPTLADKIEGAVMRIPTAGERRERMSNGGLIS